jgi:hypothetical protein
VEKRQHRRYRLSAIVNFEWESPDGVTQTRAGQTRDISATAVFIITPELLPVGNLILLDISLPSLQCTGSGLQLRTYAHVVRTDRGGFAVIAEMGFRMKFSETQTPSADCSDRRKTKQVVRARRCWH